MAVEVEAEAGAADVDALGLVAPSRIAVVDVEGAGAAALEVAAAVLRSRGGLGCFTGVGPFPEPEAAGSFADPADFASLPVTTDPFAAAFLLAFLLDSVVADLSFAAEEAPPFFFPSSFLPPAGPLSAPGSL